MLNRKVAHPLRAAFVSQVSFHCPSLLKDSHNPMTDATAAWFDDEVIILFHHIGQRLWRSFNCVGQVFSQGEVLMKHVMNVIFTVPVANIKYLDTLQHQLGNLMLFRPASWSDRL
ncbi:hypothetical protein Q0F98_09330 [Paenibacillus amylolyticus]|nr:hypothetical protein Q0F98_09330 [Paenibacillus amylolyticus]